MTLLLPNSTECERRLAPVRHGGHNAGVRSERGSVLVIVLWIAFGLVSLAIYFAQTANFEFRAADNRVAAMEAEQAIEGAARYVSNLLASVMLQTNVPPGESPASSSCPSICSAWGSSS